jgi:crotonobetainyl-CoA:carnitine CoA-transferase CaiB-like acyl-CoA transferase
MPFPRASQSLSRFTVLDLTRVRSGPTCMRQLADWGANVIKIDALLEDAGGEQPGGPAPRLGFPEFAPQQAGHDAEPEEPNGLEVFKRLAEQADVVVENFRPDVKAKLGIYLRSWARPAYCLTAVSGFGQTVLHKQAGLSLDGANVRLLS